MAASRACARLHALSGGTPALRLRALPSGRGYYILGADGSVFSFGAAAFHGSAAGHGRGRPGAHALSIVPRTVVGLPGGLRPAPPPATDCHAVQIVDDGVGLVAEPHERDAEHRPGPAATTHAVHGDPDAVSDVLDDVGRGFVDHAFLGAGIARWAATHEILEAVRPRGARCRVVGDRGVAQADDVTDTRFVQA